MNLISSRYISRRVNKLIQNSGGKGHMKYLGIDQFANFIAFKFGKLVIPDMQKLLSQTERTKGKQLITQRSSISEEEGKIYFMDYY
jgi:hypothetical protein